MLRRHSDIIKNNLTELVNKTDVYKLVPELISYGILNEAIVNKIEVDAGSSRKLMTTGVYLEVRRRGPHAFSALVRALNNSGHSYLGNLLLSEDSNHHVPRSPSPNSLHGSRDSLDSSPPHVCRIPSTISSQQPHVEGGRELLTNGYRHPDDVLSQYYASLPSVVVVQNSRHLMTSEGRPPDLYRMTSKPRGFALIINNLQFEDDEGYPLRNGAEQDHLKMESLLQQLYFDVECHVNKTKQEMVRLVEAFAAQTEWANVDCAWVILMSHGKEGEYEEDTEILGTDCMGFKTKDCISYFDNDSCPLLLNKPKIFIFQSCRGILNDNGVDVEPFSVRRRVEWPFSRRTETDGRARPRTVRDRRRSDIFIAHPVPPGIKANRDRYAGTWFIQTIVDVFARHAHYCDLEDLFKIVDNTIKNLLNPAYPNFQTVTTRTIGWNKKFYFNPGLHFEDGRLIYAEVANDLGLDVVDKPGEDQNNEMDDIPLTPEDDGPFIGCFPCGPS